MSAIRIFVLITAFEIIMMQSGFHLEEGFKHSAHKFILWGPWTELVILFQV
jgi:hypothetical protein